MASVQVRRRRLKAPVAEHAAFPVTIEHRYPTTETAQAPERVVTATVGRILGRSAEAERLVDRLEARIARERADHPGTVPLQG
jgi:ABC-type Fe3+-hydroxamate transport system substrate-binding protein